MNLCASIRSAANLHASHSNLDSVKKQFDFIARLSTDQGVQEAAAYVHKGLDSGSETSFV